MISSCLSCNDADGGNGGRVGDGDEGVEAGEDASLNVHVTSCPPLTFDINSVMALGGCLKNKLTGVSDVPPFNTADTCFRLQS